jgi:GT2 family glycosyltransferase
VKTLTIAISTYERRAAVARQLEVLAGEVGRQADPFDIDVLVIVDGSRDGTEALVDRTPFPSKLRAVWQPNGGLASTRNRALEHSEGEYIWFLDDDVVPAPGTLARHRAAHEQGLDVVMGPCPLDPSTTTVAPLVEYYPWLYDELASTGAVTRFNQFSAANTSGRVQVFEEVGGFDATFTTYGKEDFEIGYRLLQQHVEIAFDPEAVAWHHQHRTVREYCARAFDEGVNTVRVVSLHPETVDDMIPKGWYRHNFVRLNRLHVRTERRLRAVWSLATVLAEVEHRRSGGRGRRWIDLAYFTGLAAGIAAADPSGGLLGRLLEPDR